MDPAHINLLVEWFLSKERNESLDIDFEHERCEEVIQYIYAKYGRSRAALAAWVISYHDKSAMCDVARALGCCWIRSMGCPISSSGMVKRD